MDTSTENQPENEWYKGLTKGTEEYYLASKRHLERLAIESAEAYYKECAEYEKEHGKPKPLPEIKS